jgi:hypothetical protein
MVSVLRNGHTAAAADGAASAVGGQQLRRQQMVAQVGQADASRRVDHLIM